MQRARGIPFEFSTPIAFFEKADAPEGMKRRIGGLVSTESRDRQDEVVLQRGLDFSDFLRHGWYNDNHSKSTDGILGYPDRVQYIEKGSKLPDGSIASAPGHWAEGYLLETEKAQKIWELGNALQKSGRRLGYSIEGTVEQRSGSDRKTIAKARVKNVAITNCPVNTDTRLEVLAKSIQAIEGSEPDDLSRAYEAFYRALSMGPATPGVAPIGARTGAGAGRIIAPQSLEGSGAEGRSRKRARRRLNKAEAIAWLHQRLPQASATELGRIVDATLKLKSRGAL